MELIYDETGSVEGGSGWYLVVLGQQKAVLVVVHDGTGTV